MRVLITGAQGFIGRHTVDRWLESGSASHVFALGRSPGRSPAADAPDPARDPRYTYLALDIRDRSALVPALRRFQPEVVIHLAAVLRDGEPTELFSCNVEGTVSLLQALHEAELSPRVVLGSSGAVYGRCSPDQLPLREDTPLGQPLNLYAISRQAAEAAARELAARWKLPLSIARIFNPIGPGQDERHLSAHLARQLAAIADGTASPTIEVGPLDTTRDFIDVRDVAEALRIIALHGQNTGEAYNVCSGREVRCQALLDGLLTLSGQTGRTTLKRRPGRPADIPRHFGDASRLTALGFAPKFKLEDSLRAQLEWYRTGVSPSPDLRPTTTVRVSRRHSYAIEVRRGLLAEVPARLKSQFPEARMVVLTDTRVARLYGHSLLASMRSVGIECDLLSVPEGEGSKQLEVYREVVGRLHTLGFGRRSVLVCLGGGLITDVGGFVAATYLRGVQYVNVPTTLLAQHDSAVGGKVAINTPWAKNFLGAFHHPAAVYCDPEVLATLTRADLRSGVAEAIKVALTGDAALFELLESDSEGVLAHRRPDLLEQIVRRSVDGKVALLAPDPIERDLRRALNLGHTLAHPLETELAYDGLLHGHAVGYGIALATELARLRGVCPTLVAERIHRLLAAYALPPNIAPHHQIAALGRLREVRLVRGGHLHFVMPVAVDAVEIVPEVSITELRAAMYRFGVRDVQHPPKSRTERHAEAVSP